MLLIILYGIAISINFSSSIWLRWLGRFGSFLNPVHVPASSWLIVSLLLILSVVMGMIVSLIGLYVKTLLIKLTAAWINCTGSFEHIRTVVAWSTMPKIILLFVSIPLLLFQNNIFSAGGNFLHEYDSYLFQLASFAATIWTFVILIGGLAEAHKTTMGKSIGNLLLSIGIILVPLAVIVFIIFGFGFIMIAWAMLIIMSGMTGF